MADRTAQIDRLHAAADILLRRARRGDGKAGLGPAQVSALGLLAQHGPMAIRDLAETETVAHPTMSRMVSALVAAGAVVKDSDPADRRRQVVRLTGLGRRRHQEAHGRRRALIEAMAAMLRPESVDDLERALDALARR